MGCDIHSYVERKNDKDGGWECFSNFEPFNFRCYSVFAFLAGVRNYSKIPPISNPRGLPVDVSDGIRRKYEECACNHHSASWLGVDELVKFDYLSEIEDRRYTKEIFPHFFDGGSTCDQGMGRKMTFREYLCPSFFEDLDRLQALGSGRIVFWFDS